MRYFPLRPRHPRKRTLSQRRSLLKSQNATRVNHHRAQILHHSCLDSSRWHVYRKTNRCKSERGIRRCFCPHTASHVSFTADSFFYLFPSQHTAFCSRRLRTVVSAAMATADCYGSADCWRTTSNGAHDCVNVTRAMME